MNQYSPATTTATPVNSDGRANPVETGCCPPFNPAHFHDQEITWKDKAFVKERVHGVFHIPLDIGRKMSKAMRLIEASHAKTAEGLMLSDEKSPWRSDLYIDVSGPVEGAEMASLSGTFLTRVYEGPFRDAPKWCEDMKRYVVSRGRTLRKMYLGYTTCPSCAKAYGKNYAVVFAEVEPAAPVRAV